MTSSQPYIIRAFYQWLVDNQCTPYIIVDATVDGASIPQQFIKEGKITLNIATSAIQQLELGNEAITFQARFSGQPHEIYIPIHAVLAIFAQEDMRAGTFFDPESFSISQPSEPENTHSDKPQLTSVESNSEQIEPKSKNITDKKSHLTIVK